jgi:hypothetical protein
LQGRDGPPPPLIARGIVKTMGAMGSVNSASAMSNPAATFEQYRRRLIGLAYRMLGSMADAEDAHAPEGAVQTAAFEIEGGVIRALYVVRNPDKLRHVAASPVSHESGAG